MNEDGQAHNQDAAAVIAAVHNAPHSPADGSAGQAGIVEVDGAATTAEGPPVGAVAATADGQGTPAPAAPQGAPSNPQAEAAAQLAAIYKNLPGVVPALIGGATVAEVQQSYQAAQQQYADIRAQLLQEQGIAVPGAHAGTGGRPVPSDPFEMIRQGVGSLK
jgi:hypothetical protein